MLRKRNRFCLSL